MGLLPSTSTVLVVVGSLIAAGLFAGVAHRKLLSRGREVSEEGSSEGEPRGKNTGKALAESAKSALDSLAVIYHEFAKGLMPVVPFRKTILLKMTKRSLWQLWRISGADALVINAEKGSRLTLDMVKYKGPEECDDDEKPGWHAKGRDKVWSAGSAGNSVDYLWGVVPIVLLDDDDHAEAGWLKSRIGEAVQLGQHQPIYRNATIVAELPDAGQPGANGAVADGGGVNFRVEDMGIFDAENLIDIGSGEGYDGMRISHRKANEWVSESAATEEMQMQEERGRIAEMNRDADKSAIKWLLIGMGLGAGILLAPDLIAGFAGTTGGGDGGGGGSVMPFILGFGGF